jgi:hypothetical protein
MKPKQGVMGTLSLQLVRSTGGRVGGEKKGAGSRGEKWPKQCMHIQKNVKKKYLATTSEVRQSHKTAFL